MEKQEKARRIKGKFGTCELCKRKSFYTEKENGQDNPQCAFPQTVKRAENYFLELMLIMMSLIVWAKAESVRIFFSTCSNECSTVV